MEGDRRGSICENHNLHKIPQLPSRSKEIQTQSLLLGSAARLERRWRQGVKKNRQDGVEGGYMARTLLELTAIKQERGTAGEDPSFWAAVL